MGQFSWLDCVDGSQIRCDLNRNRNVYVLVPKEFGGGHIKENHYEGYGMFGGHDIYDLVADWNLDKISPKILRSVFSADNTSLAFYAHLLRRQLKTAEMLYCLRYEKELAESKLKEEYGEDYKRELGIGIACYNEQNFSLPYPIKITHDKDAVYEDCEPSKSDPNQGWKWK